MQYGQGKDPNAGLRSTKGTGWENIGQFIGGAVTAGFGAASGNGQKAMQGLNQMGSSMWNFTDKVQANKQMSSGNLNPPTTPATQTGQSMTPSLPTNSQPSAGSLASTSMDMGAGYNPQSETYRSGNGTTITDRNKTFEQQAMTALQKDNTFTASKGKKLNYLSFFN